MTNKEHSTEEEPVMNMEDGKMEDGKTEDGKTEDEVTVLKRQIEELNDKYLRLYSEFDNYRKRTQKEKLELYKTAGEDILIAVLPILDDFDRAAKAMNEEGEPDSVKTGVDLIRHKLMNILSQKGLKAMESAVGKELDTNFHEAVTRIPAPEEKLKGKVIDEIEKGYLLHDKVIRYAKVVVGE